MTTPVRWVSSEDAEEAVGLDKSVADTAAPAPPARPLAGYREEGALGLPEEGENLKGKGFKDEILGETPPPLAAELEDRGAGPLDGAERGKTRRARWLAFVWPTKPKASPPPGGDDKRGGREEIVASVAAAPQGSEDRAGVMAAGEDNAAPLDGMGEREAAAAPAPAKRRRPRMKIALAAALAAGVAIAAIVVVTWPHSPPPAPVEPG